MASPLLPYANARLLVPSLGTVTQVDGRWVEAPGDSYLVKIFCSRKQYSGVSSGSVNIPLASQLGGEMLPGASGDQFYYRGYSLEQTTVAANWDLDTGDETALTWTTVSDQPDWLLPGTVCKFKLGDDPVMPAARVQRSSGVYGGKGIDEILYKEIGGVQIQITGGEVQR